MSRLDDLRAQWLKASEKDKVHDAVKALVELEKLEMKEPRWSQRLGEAYRRLGKTPEAVDAFARAFQRYFEQGFLPRAIAMAKLVRSLDAARGDLLEASLPKDAAPPPPVAAKPSPVVAPPVAAKPAPVVAPPPVAAKPSPVVAPPPVAAVQPPPARGRHAPLLRAEDSSIDEVRFVDAPESSIEIVLDDLNNASASIVVDFDDEPPAEIVGASPSRMEPGLDAYATMATFRLFAALSRDALVALANASELVEFVPGAMVIVRDERAFALYAIVSGTARVTVSGSDKEVHLKEGDIFGESSLLDEGQRQADVRAETELMTLRIDKRALDAVMKEFPEIEDALFDLLARRLITNLMHTSPLFASFEPSQRLELAQKFEVRRAPPGTVIMERGRRSDALYVLLAGNVVADADGNASAVRIARGAPFGQASLLGVGAAEATIRAVSEAVLLRMPAAGFAALAALYPPALAHLAELASDPLPVSRRTP